MTETTDPTTTRILPPLRPAAPGLVPIVVINLARAADRLAVIADHLGGLGLAFTRFDAWDGRADPEMLARRMQPHPLTVEYGRALTEGEIGCAASFQDVMESIAAGPDPFVCVLEDDALSDDDLLFLMSHDSDAFNRWQAGQDYATRLLIASVKALRKDKAPPDPSRFIEALGQVASDEILEPALRAQTLALPSETDLARVIAKDIDPDAIHKARNTLRRKLAQTLGARLEGIYEEMAVKEPYAPVPDQIARRTLRNSVLGLLTARGTAADVARAARHFNSASNLTDEIAGLAALSETRGSERKTAFERFYERWHDDHIVIDHWFLYQAAIPHPGTLATVKRLARHPLMSLENPNKVRTLIGAFAANPVAFNRPDGAGYDFVAERILQIDRFNPQLAARLLTAFRSWRTLESTRRKLAERALKGISKSKPLSRDVYEIVTRTLE